MSPKNILAKKIIKVQMNQTTNWGILSNNTNSSWKKGENPYKRLKQNNFALLNLNKAVSGFLF